MAAEKIDLERITQPVYAVSAVDDHIAPWKQAFKINAHVSGPKRFVLSSSGHILGIVNPPVTPSKREFWAAAAERHETAENWQEHAERRPGSWWEDWMAWPSHSRERLPLRRVWTLPPIRRLQTRLANTCWNLDSLTLSHHFRPKTG